MRKPLAVAGLVLACVGIVTFLTIGIWVWSLRAEVRQQADYLAEKARMGADAADHAIQFVREVITKADEELALARTHTAAPDALAKNPLLMMAARKASQDLAGSVERAHGAVVTASDAVIVADAALEVFSDNPVIERYFGVNTQQTESTRQALSSVAADLRQARQILVVPVPGSDSPATPEQLNTVEQALREGQQFTNEMSKVVTAARSRVKDTHRLVEVWSRRVAIITSLISVLAVLGQVFMARFCIRTLRGEPA